MKAFVFPGQGSQFIGMGKDLAEAFSDARDTFEEVNDAIGKDLFKLMTEGAEADLNLTENTQPALMAVSMAINNVITRQGGIQLTKTIHFVAGHSLGEYSALTAAGSLELSKTAKLLKLRGQAMQRAVPVGEGSMAAILGLDLPAVQEIVAEATKQIGNGKLVECANDNSPGQVVISGHKEAVALAMELATAKGAKRALELPVSAPFHCTLMAPAAHQMSYALADTNIRPPVVPCVSNVLATGIKEPHEIRRLLVDQITGMVRWQESIAWMKAQGVTEIIELGAGKVLSGLIKRIDKEIVTDSVGTPEQIEALITKLQG